MIVVQQHYHLQMTNVIVEEENIINQVQDHVAPVQKEHIQMEVHVTYQTQ